MFCLASSSIAASSAVVWNSQRSGCVVAVATSPAEYHLKRVSTPSVGWLTKPSSDMDMLAVT